MTVQPDVTASSPPSRPAGNAARRRPPVGLLRDIRAVARSCGYAVAIHGSLSRDFDGVSHTF